MKIEISATVKASLEQVWSAWTEPNHIMRWNFASDDWCCPRAAIDLTIGSRFNYRMEARDGSMGFDFEGTFTEITPSRLIAYSLDDMRKVRIEFSETDDGIIIKESFEAENEMAAEQQRQGWQCILNNFKRHVEQSGI